jgi:hypothetical protein
MAFNTGVRIPPSPSRVAWAVLLLTLVVASVGGVAHRALGYPAVMPEALARFLASFIEPGLSAWWFTLGGPFQSFPSSASGYAVTVVANVAFWLLLAFVAFGAVRHVWHRLGPRK